MDAKILEKAGRYLALQLAGTSWMPDEVNDGDRMDIDELAESLFNDAIEVAQSQEQGD